jgi:hypothetical protein
MSVHSSLSWLGPERLLARATMTGNAVILIVLGWSVLDRPSTIPLAVGLWLGAAAIMGLALCTRLEK